MEFIRSHQLRFEELTGKTFDLLIVASGYESRCSWLIDNNSVHAQRKLAIAFAEKKGKFNRKKNNLIFRNQGFDFLEISGEESQKLESTLNDILRDLKKDVLSVLIDYSCMTKLWYATVINYFMHEDEAFERIDIYFSYTPAKFNKGRRTRPASKINSLSVGPSKFNPSKPTALIMGLGIEKGLSDFVYNKIKPDVCCLMYADPAPENSYVKELFENNRDIIDQVDVRNLISYPLDDLEKTDELLTNLCLQLRLNYNVIIVSLGPKVFSLNCLMLAARYPDVDVWRITASQNSTVVNRIPTGKPLVLKTTFANDEDDY